MIRSESYQREC